MNFPPSVMRWKNLARDEIAREAYPFPTEYVLAVLKIESNGQVGIVNPRSGASGLMQVMPGTLDGYNRNNNPDIPLDTLRAKEPWAAAEQIRVGVWVMGRYIKKGYNWLSETNPNPALSDLIKISDLMYVAGPGKINRKFGNLPDRSFDSLVASAPDWQPFAHPRKVWRWTAIENSPVWDTAAIDSWVTGSAVVPPNPPLDPPPPPGGSPHQPMFGFLLAVSILAVASFYMGKR